MTSVLLRDRIGEDSNNRESGHMKSVQRNWSVCLQAKQRQGLLGQSPEALVVHELLVRHGKDPPLEPPANTLILDFWSPQL